MDARGLYRLKENGQFSSSKTTEETKAEFMRVSDPFNAWLSDSCTFISEAFLTRQEAYDNYRDYSDELGAEPDSAKSFYQKMRQTPRIKDTRIRIKGKIERVFHGITLKTETEEDEEQTKLENVTSVPDVTLPLTRQYIEKNKKEKAIGDISPVTSVTPVTSSVKINMAFFSNCFLCGRRLPDDLADCTYLDGKPVHCSCFNKNEAQKKKIWICPQFGELEGQPFCKIIQSILAKPEDCSPDCSLLQEDF